MSAHFYEADDYVAIMLGPHSATSSVLEIAKVERVEDGMVYLPGGRAYERWGGTGITSASHGIMVPATEAHRSALNERRMATN
jgi:hypothetical protein